MAVDHEKLEDQKSAIFSACAALGVKCADAREADFYGIKPLDFALNTLMTELWDLGFSQTEIRSAYIDALDDMDRYAAGQERR